MNQITYHILEDGYSFAQIKVSDSGIVLASTSRWHDDLFCLLTYPVDATDGNWSYFSQLRRKYKVLVSSPNPITRAVLLETHPELLL